MNGILIIDKPKGISCGILSRKIQKQFGLKRVGHCGTLDPFATGVLVLCVNEATKMMSALQEQDKVYEGVLLLGTETHTFDSTGEIVSHQPVDGVSDDTIKSQMKQNVGTIEQLPPMYSAVKVNGKPLYIYARKNKEVERKPRRVTIHSFEFLSREGTEVRFRIHCSKGTYVRTICHELGKQLGTVACLKELRRIQSGQFSIQEASAVDLLTEKTLFKSPHWKGLSEVIREYPFARLPRPISFKIRQGYTPRFSEVVPFISSKNETSLESDTVYFLDYDGDPLAIAMPHKQAQVFKLTRVFNI